MSTALRTLVVAAALVLLSAKSSGAQQTGDVEFVAAVAPDTVFVGQQATYSLTVRIPSDVRQRLRRNPEFVPPEPRSMLAYELPLARVTGTNEGVEMHTFRRALFALTPGRYSIPTARLTYFLPQSASFFSREEERTLRSQSVSFVAVEPPAAGRPSEWGGAVGVWRAAARVEPADPRVGDPMVLTLRLEGEGNPTVLPRPRLEIPWADVVPQGEQVVLEAAPLMLGGAKEFTWLVTPRQEGETSIAPIAYAFFDPLARAYAIARTDPVTVRVRPGSIVAVPQRRSERRANEGLSIRSQLAGPARVTLPWPQLLMWIALLAPVPAIVIRLVPTRRQRGQQEREPERSARALLERGLRERTGIDLAAHTAPGALTAALRLEGVTPQTARAVEELRDTCDRDAFARRDRRSVGATAREKALQLLKQVGDEARTRVLLLLLAITLVGCADRATTDAASLQAFREGTTAYSGGDFASAREAFRRAASSAPRDPAVWENLGTAAWAANDTAWAVVGWQRALRLAPANDSLRNRLALVRASQFETSARVWPVSPLLPAAAALLLWLLGCGWAFARARRGLRLRTTSVLLVPALVLAALSLYLDTALEARDLVVIMQPSSLRALPALGADPGAVPLAGEVALVRERQGVWLRIELEAGREGWYPAERVQSLRRD